MKKVIFLFLFFLIISCASQRDFYMTDSPIDSGANKSYRAAHSTEQEIVTLNSGVNPQQVERKIITTSFLSIETCNPDTVKQQVAKLAKKYNGYVQLQRKDQITGEDVTDSWYDLQIRLDNAQKARERYLELLSRAENVKSALEVEKELERLNREIDLLQGQFNRMQHLVQNVTITVYTVEPVKPGPLGYVFYGLYKAIVWLFVR